MKKEKEPIAKPLSLSEYWDMVAQAVLSFKGKQGARVISSTGRKK